MPTRFTPRLKSPLHCVLADFLTQQVEKEGGFLNLTGAITNAYMEGLVDAAEFSKSKVINREKVTKLARGDRSVTLSMQELEALHCYLAKSGHGLDREPLFSQPNILQALSSSISATFCLGSDMKDDGSYLAHFDMLAMIQIQRAVNHLGKAMSFDVFDVHGTKRKKGEAARPWDRVFKRYGPSAICIASPRANQATELALRKMLRVEKGPTPWSKLPFYFVWSSKGCINQQKSHFARPVEAVAKTHPELAAHVKSGKGWGLVVGDQVFLSDRPAPNSSGQRGLKSHGVILAQRQREGQIWVVVAGLSGPGTYLASTCLRDMTGTLPLTDDPLGHAVLWGVVEGEVRTKAMIDKGQLPELSGPRFVVGPHLWDPARRAPVC